MNLILFDQHEIRGATLGLTGRRARHILEVHRAREGDELRVGQIDGMIGSAILTDIIDDSEQPEVRLEVALKVEPPPPLDLTLFLALPRPKFLKKTLQTVATLGVKDIYLMNAVRVEKVYWSCEQLSENEVREAFLLGLEQARDTKLPRLHMRRLFKPFVEDEAPALIRDRKSYVAHPTATAECPRGLASSLALAIGPEGGFIPYEVAHLENAGFTPVTIGPRILKVETAVTALISRLC
ncbi:MAG TPA: 16S rRNA (uracil(1498)-N(3))-methyltransferase [Bdellovibrionales bacterium]|nr:16S rRNA (uracil(1498)-N(3))-methyltransferase [Bdellovibrionales bacterium]